jgi:hypothetical protein
MIMAASIDQAGRKVNRNAVDGVSGRDRRRLLPLVVETGARAAPHTWGELLKTLCAAQLAAGHGNIISVEGIPAAPVDHDWRAYQLVDGALRVPDLPRFGVRLLA